MDLYSKQYISDQQERFYKDSVAREAHQDDLDRWNDAIDVPKCIVQIMASTPTYTPEPCGECYDCKRMRK